MPPVSERLTIRKAQFISAAVVFLTAFVVYLMTLAPTVTLVDSGELILAAAKLGVAHPPGFPLWVMLAHLASMVPIGSVAVRIHVADALFAALAAAMMTLLVAEVMLTATARQSAKGKKGKSTEAPPEPKMSNVIGPAVMAGLLFAFSRTLWAYATIAEVYTLNSLLIVTILWLMFAWRREFDANAPSYQRLYIAALVFGLAMGVHHVSVAFFLPSLAYLVYSTAGTTFYFSRRFLFSALIAIAGLVTVYAYLPLAASRSPLMNWGEPTTFDAIWRHISGRQYQVFFDFDPRQFLDLGKLLLREWGLVWLPAALVLALLGFVDSFRRNRVTFTFVVAAICMDVMYCTVYNIAEDKDAYYLPTFISITIAAAFGARWVLERINAPTKTSLVTPMHIAVALLIVPIIALASNLPYNNRSSFYVAHDYVDNIASSVEPGGMVLTADWQPYAPSFYVRDIEGQHRDLIFIDLNLLRRGWYLPYLEKEYPDIIARSRPQVNAYLEDLRAWERDPGLYDRSPGLRARITARFHEMVTSIVTEQFKTAPVYITFDVPNASVTRDLGLMNVLQENREMVPQGLVFRVAEKGSTTTLMPPEIQTRGLNDGTMKFEEDDVVARTVIPTYVSMLSNTGIYLRSRHLDNAARKKFEQALKLDPNYEPAKNGIAGLEGHR